MLLRELQAMKKQEQDKVLKMINEGIDYANPVKTWKGINLLTDDLKVTVRNKALDEVEKEIIGYENAWTNCINKNDFKDLFIEDLENLLDFVKRLREKK